MVPELHRPSLCINGGAELPLNDLLERAPHSLLKGLTQTSRRCIATGEERVLVRQPLGERRLPTKLWQVRSNSEGVNLAVII